MFDIRDIEKQKQHNYHVISHFERRDILVNNAKFKNINIEVDKEIFDINVLSLINLNKNFFQIFSLKSSKRTISCRVEL